MATLASGPLRRLAKRLLAQREACDTLSMGLDVCPLTQSGITCSGKCTANFQHERAPQTG
eukprot:220939-Pleurochrysis_carterae.AAC.3